MIILVIFFFEEEIELNYIMLNKHKCGKNVV